MWNTERRSLPAWIQDGYEILEPHIDGRQEGITRDRAYEILLADDDFEDEPADAKYAVKRLLERGWLYEVDDELRITDPEW